MAEEIQGGTKRFTVPPGLKCLLEEMSREVLRHRPEKIYEFLADYLENKILKQKCGGENGETRSSGPKKGRFAEGGGGSGEEPTGKDSGELANSENPNVGTTQVDPSKTISSGNGSDGQPSVDSSNTRNPKAPFGYDAEGKPVRGPNKNAPYGYGRDGKPLTQLDPNAPLGYGSDGRPLTGISCIAPYGLDKNGEILSVPDPNAPFGYHLSDGLPVATNDPTAPFGYGRDGNPLTARDPNALLGYSVNGQPNTTPETVSFCGDTAQNPKIMGNNSQSPAPVSTSNPDSNSIPGFGIGNEPNQIQNSAGDQAIQNNPITSDAGVNPEGSGSIINSQDPPARQGRSINPNQTGGSGPGNSGRGNPSNCSSADGTMMFIGAGGTKMLLSYDPCQVHPSQPPIKHMANAATNGLSVGNDSEVGDVIRTAVESMLGRVVSLMSGIMAQNNNCGASNPGGNQQNFDPNSIPLEQTDNNSDDPRLRSGSGSNRSGRSVNPQVDPMVQNLGQEQQPRTGTGSRNSGAGEPFRMNSNTSQPETGSTPPNNNVSGPPPPPPPRQTYVDAEGRRRRCIPEELKQFVPGQKCSPSNPREQQMLGQLRNGPSGFPPGFRPSRMDISLEQFQLTAYDPNNPDNVAIIQQRTQSTVAFGTIGNPKRAPPPIPPRQRPDDARLQALQVQKGDCKTTNMGDYIESIVGRAADLMSLYKAACVNGIPVNGLDEVCVSDDPNAPCEYDSEGRPIGGPSGGAGGPMNKGLGLNSALCGQDQLTSKTVGRHLQDLAPQLKEQMEPLSSDDEHTLMLLTTVGSLLDTIEETGLAQMDPVKLCSDQTLQDLAEQSERMLVSLQSHLEKITGVSIPEGEDSYMSQITREAHEALKIGAESLAVAVTLLKDVIPLCEELREDPEQLEKCAAEISSARKTMEDSLNSIGAGTCGQDGDNPQEDDDERKRNGGKKTGRGIGSGSGADPTNTNDETSSTENPLNSDAAAATESPTANQIGNDGIALTGSTSNPNFGDAAAGTDIRQDDAENQTNPNPDLGPQNVLSKTHMAGDPSMEGFRANTETSTDDNTSAPFGFDTNGQPLRGPDANAPFGYDRNAQPLKERDPNAPFGYDSNGQPIKPKTTGQTGVLAKTAKGGSGGEAETLYSSAAKEAESTAQLNPRTVDNWSGSVGNFMRSQMNSVQNLLNGETPLSEARGQIIFLTVSFVVGVVVGYAIARSVGLLGPHRSSWQTSLFGTRQRAIESASTSSTCGVSLEDRCGISEKVFGCKK